MENWEKEWRKNREISDRESMEETKQAILNGEIYADVKSVARSGMSRRIAFYRVKDGKMYRCTAEIGWLTGWLPFQDIKQGKKYVNEEGLRVDGCGMDMIFHTLYTALPYGTEWNQKYNTL